MIENLQNELFIKTNKQKALRFVVTSDGSGGWKILKNLFQSTQKTISALYTDDNKSKYSSNLKDIFKFEKKNLGNTLQQGDNFQS